MSAEEHTGSGDPAEPYVALLRGISTEVHDHEVRMAQSKGYDAGWLDGIDHAIRMTRDETKAQRRQHLERLSRTYGIWRRRFLEEFFCCALLVLVPPIALYLTTKG